MFTFFILPHATLFDIGVMYLAMYLMKKLKYVSLAEDRTETRVTIEVISLFYSTRSHTGLIRYIGGMGGQEGLTESRSIESDLSEIQIILTTIETALSLQPDIHDLMLQLSGALYRLEEGLPLIFTLDVQREDIDKQLTMIQNGKDTYFAALETLEPMEHVSSHLLDILENETVVSTENGDFGALFDLIESCTLVATNLTQWLHSRRFVLDASLEFNEIFIDHIESLESVIAKNIEMSFEIQEDKFSSPVRHTPSFTLKQLIRLLSSNAEDSEVKVPTFTSAEEALCGKFLALRHSIPPIEKSLTEILPERIKQFGRRNVPNIEYMSSLLEEKSKDLSTKFRFMVNEVRDLKVELIDKRWCVLFRNLNHELSSILDDVETLQHKIAYNDYSSAISTKFKQQLQKKFKTITKTFNVIYRALEFSLLDAEVASETNRLAQKWLDIRPTGDRILADSKYDETDIQSLTEQLKKLKVGNKTPPMDQTGPQRNNFGAMLLKKMNIRPVMVTGSPTSAAKINPFYEKSSVTEIQKASEGLILKTVPLLPYSDQQNSSSEEIFEKSPESSSGQTSRSVESLESEKVRFYSIQRSRIPTLRDTTLVLSCLRTPPPKSIQHWTPFPPRGQSLQRPTPVSVLLSSGMM